MRYAMIVLSLLISISACTVYQSEGSDQAKVLSANARPGSGHVDSVGVLRGGGGNSAAAGGSKRPDPNAYRLSLRMDNGGYQTVDVDSATFMAGEDVEVTADGRVLRISGTTLRR